MELVILDLATLGAVSSIALLCAIGVVALPWTDSEARQAVGALRAIPEAVRAGAGALAPDVPVPERWSSAARR